MPFKVFFLFVFTIYWYFPLQFGSTLVLWAPSCSSWSSSSSSLTLPIPGMKCGWGMLRRAIQSVGSQVWWEQGDILFTTIALKGCVSVHLFQWKNHETYLCLQVCWSSLFYTTPWRLLLLCCFIYTTRNQTTAPNTSSSSASTLFSASSYLWFPFCPKCR